MGVIRESEALNHGKDVLRWMQDHWFVADEYAKIAGRPLLLVFGPQYFKGVRRGRSCFRACRNPRTSTL